MMVNGIIPAEYYVTIRSDSHENLLRHIKTEEDAVTLLSEFTATKVTELIATHSMSECCHNP